MSSVLESTVKLSNGLAMPRFGLGTWRSEKGAVEKAVKFALEHGYKHIDAAFCYGNQAEVGRGIKRSGVPRQDIFVTSKVWNTHLDPVRLRSHVEKILSDLDMSYVDLMLIHYPAPFKYQDEDTIEPKDADGNIATDSSVDIRDSWAILEECVEDGLCKSIGVSNFDESHLNQILGSCKIKPAVNQIEVHPFFQNAEVRRFCKERDIAITAYSPLGNFDPTASHPSPLRDPVVNDLAKKHGKSPAQIILRWQLEMVDTVIPKSVTSSRIEENSQLDFQLTSEDKAAIDALGVKNFRTCNPRYAPNGQLHWPNDTTVF